MHQRAAPDSYAGPSAEPTGVLHMSCLLDPDRPLADLDIAIRDANYQVLSVRSTAVVGQDHRADHPPGWRLYLLALNSAQETVERGHGRRESRRYRILGDLLGVVRRSRSLRHVAFREDELRVGDPVARENLAVLRHVALTRLKQDRGTKLGIQNKRLKAGWDERYLTELLFEPPHSTTGTGPSGAGNIS
jgi:hypothetical protein